jgi:thioredoxin-like negative regulator of GroEL
MGRIACLFLFLALVMAPSCPAQATANPVADKATAEAVKLGFSTDKNATMTRAAAEERLVLAFFTTDWCSWCRRLEADVLSTPAFLAGSSSWLKLVIDAEKGDGKDWAKRFHVRGFPTLILLDAQGQEIDRQSGYSPMPEFLSTFQNFATGVGTLKAMKAELEAHPQNHALSLQVARKEADRGEGEAASARLKAIVEADAGNLSGVADEAQAELAMQAFVASKDPQGLEAVLERWPSVEQGPEIYNILVGSASKAGDEARIRRLLDRMVEQYPDNPELLNSYAWTCAEKGWDLEKAEGVAARAVELSQGDPGILDTLAEVQYKRGKVEEATATLRLALAKRPGDAYLEGQLKRFQTKP